MGAPLVPQQDREPQHDREASVYGKLKTMVINHRFKPGERLQIIELADRLGVSGTPVREALNRLQAENLLSGIPNKGFFAKPLSLDELRNLHHLNQVLIRHAIEQYCCAGAPCAAASLEDLLVPLTERLPADRMACAEHLATTIERLVEAFAALSQNDAISRVVRNALDRTHYIRRLDLEVSTDRPAVHLALVEMFERIRNRDAAAATKIFDDLVTRRLTIMPQLVREGIMRHYVDAPGDGMAATDTAAAAECAS